MTQALLGLGSNLGDRLATLQRAVDRLAAHGVRATACSRVWATAPQGGPEDQPEFLNVVRPCRSRHAGTRRRARGRQ